MKPNLFGRYATVAITGLSALVYGCPGVVPTNNNNGFSRNGIEAGVYEGDITCSFAGSPPFIINSPFLREIGHNGLPVTNGNDASVGSSAPVKIGDIIGTGEFTIVRRTDTGYIVRSEGAGFTTGLRLDLRVDEECFQSAGYSDTISCEIGVGVTAYLDEDIAYSEGDCAAFGVRR